MNETLAPQEVALRVRPYITTRHIGDIALEVDDARIHLRNGYWNIPICPSPWPNPLFPYYDMKLSPKSKTKCRSRKG